MIQLFDHKEIGNSQGRSNPVPLNDHKAVGNSQGAANPFPLHEHKNAGSSAHARSNPVSVIPSNEYGSQKGHGIPSLKGVHAAKIRTKVRERLAG